MLEYVSIFVISIQSTMKLDKATSLSGCSLTALSKLADVAGRAFWLVMYPLASSKAMTAGWR